MYKKVIIQGRLLFGDTSYEKVSKLYENRSDNYYRGDVIFEKEDIFVDEENMMSIPRFVGQVTEKTFKNTVGLLAYSSQFALMGSLKAWLIEEGKILRFEIIEPESDKAAVQQYIKGKSLVKQEGKQEEAIVALNKAIEKFNKHAQAYERRAKVNYIMKKYHDAMRDYNKSISIDPSNPHAYYGRAKINLINENLEEAIKDLEMALRTSVALQPLYWKSRRLKARSHIKLKQYEKALFDLKLFTMRKFDEDKPNFLWKKWAFYNYGIVLMENEDYEAALTAFDEASKIEEGYGEIEESSILRNRGLAKRKAGKNGYIKDIKDAAEMGDADAKLLLKEIA